MAGFVYLREASKNQKEIKMFKKIDENRVHGHKNPLKTTHILEVLALAGSKFFTK